MLFSVIIPVYNAEKTLRRCLDSLVSQVDERVELILVNDGSTDASDEICREYCTKYANIRYIVQNNSGVSAARNVGIEHARGKYVSFVDSDDYVTDRYFDSLQSKPKLDLLAFSAVEECDGVRPGTEIKICYDETVKDNADYFAFVKAFLQTRNGSPWNKRFCLSMLRENSISFPIELSVGEDFVFCLRYVMAACSAGIIDDCLYVVDESNRGSLSRRYDPNFCTHALLIYQYSFDAIIQSSFDATQKGALLQVLDYNYYRTGYACIKMLFRTKMSRNERIKSTKKILSAFAAEDRHIPPQNATHWLSKFVVNNNLAHIAHAIAWIHNCVYGFAD